MAVNEVRFRLRIPAHRYLAHYQGTARTVMAVTLDGKRVQFPARLLVPYVSREGVFGEFILRYDENNKAIGLEKVSG